MINYTDNYLDNYPLEIYAKLSTIFTLLECTELVACLLSNLVCMDVRVCGGYDCHVYHHWAELHVVYMLSVAMNLAFIQQRQRWAMHIGDPKDMVVWSVITTREWSFTIHQRLPHMLLKRNDGDHCSW